MVYITDKKCKKPINHLTITQIVQIYQFMFYIGLSVKVLKSKQLRRPMTDNNAIFEIPVDGHTTYQGQVNGFKSESCDLPTSTILDVS